MGTSNNNPLINKPADTFPYPPLSNISAAVLRNIAPGFEVVSSNSSLAKGDVASPKQNSKWFVRNATNVWGKERAGGVCEKAPSHLSHSKSSCDMLNAKYLCLCCIIKLAGILETPSAFGCTCVGIISDTRHSNDAHVTHYNYYIWLRAAANSGRLVCGYRILLVFAGMFFGELSPKWMATFCQGLSLTQTRTYQDIKGRK